MARLPRLIIPGMPHHFIHRGNNRCAIFRENQDYRYFLNCWWEASAAHQCDVHAYVLMTNHVHFLLTPQTQEALSDLSQSVGGRYVKYYNAKYRRTGTLWDGRYRATVVDSEPYFLVCSRYIEMNPVRAGLAPDPRSYPWSSFQHHALGFLEPPLRDHSIYRALGNTLADRCNAYLRLFEDSLSEAMLQAIRHATNNGWVLGGQQFRERMEQASGRRCAPLAKGRVRRGAGRKG